jgi:protein-S-isoprenylcysteine O-methyltransferase Ste14
VDNSQRVKRQAKLTSMRIAGIFVVSALFVLGLFSLAGRWDWIAGWVYLGMLIAGAALNDVCLWLNNPDLLERRGQIGEGTKTWDKICLALFGLTYLLILVVGALDAGRYRWSAMPFLLWPVGATLFVAGQALVTWSMLANPFFEKTARIQTDRGHKVIDSGPYRYVRHPGYLGTIVGFILATPLMLGSWWSVVPAVLATLSVAVRTALEDRMLLQELEGYKAYAKRVRYRLIPLFW